MNCKMLPCSLPQGHSMFWSIYWWQECKQLQIVHHQFPLLPFSQAQATQNNVIRPILDRFAYCMWLKHLPSNGKHRRATWLSLALALIAYTVFGSKLSAQTLKVHHHFSHFFFSKRLRFHRDSGVRNVPKIWGRVNPGFSMGFSQLRGHGEMIVLLLGLQLGYRPLGWCCCGLGSRHVPAIVAMRYKTLTSSMLTQGLKTRLRITIVVIRYLIFLNIHLNYTIHTKKRQHVNNWSGSIQLLKFILTPFPLSNYQRNIHMNYSVPPTR